MSKKWQRGEIATIITIGTLVILGISTLVSSVFLNSQKKQVTSSKAAEITTCRDNPDTQRTPPGGYSWKADCNKPCTTNGQCPQNDIDPSNVTKETSNWCYGFAGPNNSSADWRCLMLVKVGGVQPTQGSAPNQGHPTSTPVPPNNGGNNGGGSSNKPGDKCRYSQMNGSAVVCYEGNVKPDGNCGYVPGVSTGIEISCSGNYPPTGGNNPAPTQAPQPGGSADEGSACSAKGQVVDSCVREDCDTGIKHWVQIEKYCGEDGKIEYRAGADTARSCSAGGSQSCQQVSQPEPTTSTSTSTSTGGNQSGTQTTTSTGGQNSASTPTPALSNGSNQTSTGSKNCKMTGFNMTILNGMQACAPDTENMIITCNNGLATWSTCSGICVKDINKCVDRYVSTVTPSPTQPPNNPNDPNLSSCTNVNFGTPLTCVYGNHNPYWVDTQSGSLYTRFPCIEQNKITNIDTYCGNGVSTPTPQTQNNVQNLILVNNFQNKSFVIESIIGDSIGVPSPGTLPKLLAGENKIFYYDLSAACKLKNNQTLNVLSIIYTTPEDGNSRKMKSFNNVSCSNYIIYALE